MNVHDICASVTDLDKVFSSVHTAEKLVGIVVAQILASVFDALKSRDLKEALISDCSGNIRRSVNPIRTQAQKYDVMVLERFGVLRIQSYNS